MICLLLFKNKKKTPLFACGTEQGLFREELAVCGDVSITSLFLLIIYYHYLFY